MELQKYTDSNPIQVLMLYSDPPDVFSIDHIVDYKKSGMYGDTYSFYRSIKYTPNENEENEENEENNENNENKKYKETYDIKEFFKSFTTGGYTTTDPIDYKSLHDNKKNILLDINNRVKLAQLILKGAIINMITPEIVKQAIFNNSIMAKKLYLYCNDKGTLENTGNRNINTSGPSSTLVKSTKEDDLQKKNNDNLQNLIQGNIAEITFDFFIKMIKNDLKQKYSDIENNDDNFKEYFKKLLHWNPSVLNIGEEGELARNMLHIHDKNDFILKYIRGEIIMDITQNPVVFYIESNDTLNYKISKTKSDRDDPNNNKITIQSIETRKNILIESFKPIIISESPDTLPDHILSKIDPIFLANEMVKKPSIKEKIIQKIPPLGSNLDTIINAIKTYLNTQANPYNKQLNMGSDGGAGIKHTKRKSKKIRRHRRKRTKRVRY
jgi:hypothetical protein